LCIRRCIDPLRRRREEGEGRGRGRRRVAAFVIYVVCVAERRFPKGAASHRTRTSQPARYAEISRVYRIKTCRETIKCFSGRGTAERGSTGDIYGAVYIATGYMARNGIHIYAVYLLYGSH